MDSGQIQTIIINALHMANQARTDDNQLTVAPDAPLFGDNGQLDSLGIVALIIDIEEALAESGCNVTLTAERAMSCSQSPFKDVPSLVAYIGERLRTE